MKIYLLISDALMDCGEPEVAYTNERTAECESNKHNCHIKEIELKGRINAKKTKTRKEKPK